ncbi:MAG: hypothetical protein R3D69_06470 [Xanthobacteraceae bacterium]
MSENSENDDARDAYDVAYDLANDELPAIGGLVAAISFVVETLDPDVRTNALLRLCTEIERHVELAEADLSVLLSMVHKSSQTLTECSAA